jgi:hypothetical protein
MEERPWSDKSTHRQIARAGMTVESVQTVLRLDHDPAPAGEVEVERHVVGHRVTAADVDIEPIALVREGERQVVVLEVLRVGELHRATG